MLNIKGPEADLGVIVGRFQTPYLTEGHRELIESVRSRHSKFAIVIGMSPVIPSKKNPLDFMSRLGMIQAAYPGTSVLPLQDNRSDELWSRSLDKALRQIHPHENIVLYGSRDSFISHYSGKFKVVELDDVIGITATTARIQAFHHVKDTEDFRRGVCYATANQYPKNVLCVDIAVYNPVDGILLASRITDGGKYRFIGGHVDVGRETAEAAGRREVQEEASCAVQTMDYIGSTPIKDWKYEGTGDSIFTIFFLGYYLHGPVIAADDIDAVTWFPIITLSRDMMVEEHKVLFDMLLRHFEKKQLAKVCANGPGR